MVPIIIAFATNTGEMIDRYFGMLEELISVLSLWCCSKK